MSSAIITALLIAVMLLIIANLVISALYEHHRYQQSLASRLPIPSHPLDHHVQMILHIHDGVAVNVEKPTISPIFTLPSSWYARRRTFASVSFLLMLFLALFIQSGLADGALQGFGSRFSFLSSYQYSSIKADAHPFASTASMRIVRVDSAARNQYYNDYQWQAWSFSSCSGIAMEEVMNSYGRNLIAADVLQVEQDLGVWDTYNGLTGGEAGIAEAASHFGFKADPHPPRTIPDLINVANKGFPVIVGVPGHILDVRGGDSNYVYLVDSAPADRTIMTRDDFAAWWNGFSVLLTPQ